MLRLERNLTQEQMGEKLSLSTSAYCKIEYGETDLTLVRLHKIAEILDIPIAELFGKIIGNADLDKSHLTASKEFKEFNSSRVDNDDTLRELVKVNTRIIDLLCKRIEMLEKHLS